MEGWRDRCAAIVEHLDASFAERGAVIRHALLAILSGQHVLFIGPPGTAKSALARAIAGVWSVGRYFEYLLTRFTHPDELLGPVSLSALKEDRYRRQTDGYLPGADLAFLDEVFRGNSAILNALLGLMHDRAIHIGAERIASPLIAILGATNADPGQDEDLAALEDRFLVRLRVGPIVDAAAFMAVAAGETRVTPLPTELRLSRTDLVAIRAQAENVALPQAVRDAIVTLRNLLNEGGVTVSDRRWAQSIALLRVAASTADRTAIRPLDLLLLEPCLALPGRDEATVRKALRTVLEPLLLPPSLGAVADAWATLSAPVTARGLGARRRQQLEAVTRFGEVLAGAENDLGAARKAFIAEAVRHPWLADVPPWLIAPFVAAARDLERFRAALGAYRSRLGSADFARDALERLRRAQALDAIVPSQGADPDEFPLWLRAPGAPPETWWPVDSSGFIHFSAGARVAGQVQRRLLDATLAGLAPLDGAPTWWKSVRCIDFDEAFIDALAEGGQSLRDHVAAAGIERGDTAFFAARALSEWLRGAGVERLMPEPEPMEMKRSAFLTIGEDDAGISA